MAIATEKHIMHNTANLKTYITRSAITFYLIQNKQ